MKPEEPIHCDTHCSHSTAATLQPQHCSHTAATAMQPHCSHSTAATLQPQHCSHTAAALQPQPQHCSHAAAALQPHTLQHTVTHTETHRLLLGMFKRTHRAHTLQHMLSHTPQRALQHPDRFILTSPNTPRTLTHCITCQAASLQHIMPAATHTATHLQIHP